MKMRNARLLSASLLTGMMLVGACVKTVVVSPANSMGASLALERFLAAANAKDLTAMSNLFGTKAGPIIKRDEKAHVETQMHLIATILRHDDYKLEGEEMVPGRREDATMLNVNIIKGKQTTMVPFIMVRTTEGQWIVECLEIERLTANSSTRRCTSASSH